MSCELVLSAYGNVSALCIDRTNGCIVVGVQDTIRYAIKCFSLNFITVSFLRYYVALSSKSLSISIFRNRKYILIS